MANTFFTSDVHLGHHNILLYCPARADRWPDSRLPDTLDKDGNVKKNFDPSVMNEGIIERWNAVVKPGDTVHNLGDFSFVNAERTLEYMKRLNGFHHLTFGNHDKVVHDNTAVREAFASTKDYRELKIDKLKLVLFHFPLVIWNRGHHGAVHLHGHCHNSLPPESTRADVGLDSTAITGVAEHRPFSFEEVRDYMAKQKFVAVDHHDGTRE